MTILGDLRLNIGDDSGAIPSGIVPPAISGFPIGTNTTSISELRVDIGDDDGIIPSGTLAGGIPVHNLLSLQHPDTTPASPSQGDIIIGGGTWTVLPSGDEGEQLTIFGGNLAWRPDAGGISAAQASGIAIQVTTTGIAFHAADPDAHHTRYTDAEAIAAISGDVAIIQESGVELTVDATTTSVLPTLSTLLSVPINVRRPNPSLRILATAAVNANGGVPVHFHIYVDGVFHRATTINVTGAIDNASILIPRIAVSGSNPHTVDLRWAKFSLPLVTVRCLPASLPNFYHASLSVQEIL